MDRGETDSNSKLGALLLASTEQQPDLNSVLIFQIAGKVFAIAVEHTEGVVDCPRLAPLPSAPDMIVGVTSVRGRILLVVNLNQAASSLAGRRRLILLKGEAQLGLLADVVEGVVALEPEAMRATPQERRSLFSRPSNIHNGRQIPVIDPERLVAILS
jgi:chemotaxis signal transduction protein